MGRGAVPQDLPTHGRACFKAKIATVEVVHIDASLIRANVSWESLVEPHVTDVLSENKREDEIEVEQKARQSGKYKKVCLTDPDATMATSARKQAGTLLQTAHRRR
jgi:hypothetical protein